MCFFFDCNLAIYCGSPSQPTCRTHLQIVPFPQYDPQKPWFSRELQVPWAHSLWRGAFLPPKWPKQRSHQTTAPQLLGSRKVAPRPNPGVACRAQGPRSLLECSWVDNPLQRRRACGENHQLIGVDWSWLVLTGFTHTKWTWSKWYKHV